MTRYHIEGMGLVGSLLAASFDEDDIPFTWSDNDAKVTAWKASTGCVFPTGDPVEASCYRLWVNLVANRQSLGRHVGDYAELGVWTYISVNPPHDGRAVGVAALTKVEGLVVSNHHTVHLNVPAFVKNTREDYADLRAKPRAGDSIIVSHGYKRAVRYGWGWSAQAELALSDELLAACSGARPCLYLRKGYLMYYAYPFPGTDDYIVGTQNVSQKEPRERPTEEPYMKWLDHFNEHMGDHGMVKRLHSDTMQQGWRPYGAKESKLISRTKSTPRTYYIQPQSGNGLRMWPATYNALRKAMDR